MTSARTDDPLTDFDARSITLADDRGEDVTRTVHVAGRGPAVIVMHEMPGISPAVARFARWVRDAGFTIYMPSLFGRDGAVPRADEGAQVFQRACIAREFNVLAGQGSSPVTHWLRGLARLAHAECGGPGVGAVGMCFTGNFALSMMLEPAMLAGVLSQPSLPLDDPSAVESSPEELKAVRTRLDRDDLSVKALRFEGDRFCPAARFAAYRTALGDRFEATVLPDSAANADVAPFFAAHVDSPHSVLTQHLRDAEGEPTLAARDAVIAYLKDSL